MALAICSGLAQGPPRPAAAEAGPTGLPKWTLVAPEDSGTGKINPSLKWPWLSSAVDIDNDGDLDFCVYGHHGTIAVPDVAMGTGI